MCFLFQLFVFRRNTYDGFEYVSILKYTWLNGETPAIR